jgi:hypothetical protein
MKTNKGTEKFVYNKYMNINEDLACQKIVSGVNVTDFKKSVGK